MGTTETLSLIGIVLVVIAHLCGTVWWMSKITTTLELLTKTVNDLSSAIVKHEATYYNKEDAMREIGKLDQKIDKAHERLDNFNETCRQCYNGKNHA